MKVEGFHLKESEKPYPECSITPQFKHTYKDNEL